jgi:hypothetical protein
MTTLTAPLPVSAVSDRGAPSLEDRLSGIWQELHVHDAATCPVCGECMTLADDAGRCGGCGSELH